MSFRPSETLKAIADYAFIVCGAIFWVVLVIFVWECHDLPCQPSQEWLLLVFRITSIATAVSWLFRNRIVSYDLDAKLEDGIIKRKTPKRKRVRYYATLTKALEEHNEGARLNAWYLTGYAAAHVLVECVRLADAPSWLYIPAILCFGIPEIHGIHIGKHTFSQTVWVFQSTGSRARLFASMAWILWIFFIMIEIHMGIPSLFLYSIPVAELCLVAGVIMWLAVGSFLAVKKAITWKRPLN